MTPRPGVVYLLHGTRRLPSAVADERAPILEDRP